MQARPSAFTRALAPALLACAAWMPASPAMAQAAWSSLSFSFVQPTGTALATDAIAVWLRLSNNDATESFTVDNSLPNGGLNLADLPKSTWVNDGNNQVEVAFASYTQFGLSTGFGCSGTFTAAGQCTQGPPYTFTWTNNPYALPFTLAPGQHLDYLWGSFTPDGGTAPAGTYQFYRAALWLDVAGLDSAGNPISTVAFPTQTCNADSAEQCVGSTFSRTVTAVPEAQTSLLMLAGLSLLAWRRRPHRAG